MKKILLTICLLVFLVGGAYTVLAQAKQANECCRIRSAFTLNATDGLGGITDDVDLTSNSLALQLNDDASIGFCDLDEDGEADTVIELGVTLGTDFVIVKTKDWGMVCFLGTIHLVTTWLFYILMLLVTIFIVYGGFLIVTSAGDPEKSGKGRKVITYAAIGLAVALLARVIPSLVRFVIGV